MHSFEVHSNESACSKKVCLGMEKVHCYIFDSWFASNSSSDYEVDVDYNIFGMVKTKSKYFCKYSISNMTKDWPGESYLVLNRNPILPGDNPLVDIDYKYNSHKVLSFSLRRVQG